jgi:4-methoxybenzoate monooxygenase (O-demethylating)
LATTHSFAPTSDIDPFAEQYILDPYPFHQEMREGGPVVWLEKWNVFAVARYEQVQTVLADWQTFCSGGGVGLADLRHGGGWRKPSALLETDPPDHTANRAIISRVLSPAVLRDLRSTFEEEAVRFADRALAAGTIEATSELAEAFPMKVFADAVGIRPDGREHLVAYGNMVFNGMGPRNELFERAWVNAEEVIEWVAAACQRKALAEDGLGARIYESADAGVVDEVHAALIVRSFLSAGIDTTTYAIGNALFCFAQNPEQWSRIRSDKALVKPAFEELMRFESPFQTFFRTAASDAEIAGVRIPKDSKIMLSVGAANRDPRKWTDPDTFDIARNTKGHVGFGAGIHGCVGQLIARLEVETLLTALADRVERIELAGEPVRQLHNTLRGFERLPMRFQA